MTKIAKKSKADWLIPAGLVVLSVVPAIGGIARLAQLRGGIPATPDDMRFHSSPTPIVLHIAAVMIYSLLGAFQFSPGFRKRHPRWHRIAGRVLLVAGMVAALTGLWMTQFYAWPAVDGFYVYLSRLIVGTAMTASLFLGFTTVLKRDFDAHAAWMIRAYALGLGAGTQVFTHIPYFVFPQIQGELARTICMAAGWAINWAMAEWIIARGRRGPARAVQGFSPLPLRT